MAVPGLDPGISPAIHVFSAPPVDKAQARPHANRVSPDNIRSPPVSKSTHKTTKPRQHSHTNPHPCQGNFSYFTTARTRLPLHRHAGEGLQSTSFPLSSPRRRPGSTTSLLACPNPQSIPLHRLGPRRRTIHASLPSPALNCPVIIISPPARRRAGRRDRRCDGRGEARRRAGRGALRGKRLSIGTDLDEFFRVKMRENFHDTIGALQADLDTWLHHDNTERPHLGYRSMGRRPIDTVMQFGNPEG